MNEDRLLDCLTEEGREFQEEEHMKRGEEERTEVRALGRRTARLLRKEQDLDDLVSKRESRKRCR